MSRAALRRMRFRKLRAPRQARISSPAFSALQLKSLVVCHNFRLEDGEVSCVTCHRRYSDIAKDSPSMLNTLHIQSAPGDFMSDLEFAVSKADLSSTFELLFTHFRDPFAVDPEFRESIYFSIALNDEESSLLLFSLFRLLGVSLSRMDGSSFFEQAALNVCPRLTALLYYFYPNAPMELLADSPRTLMSKLLGQ